MASRYFTIDEANAALEIIRPLMDEAQAIRARIMQQRPEIWPALERAAGNGGSPALSKLVAEFDQLNDIVHRILATGAQIKDLSTGLLDFPSLRNDQEVLLCWKHGEAEVLFWHELEAGFAGRRPIAEF
jgi:hypothetical protein